MNTKIRLAMSAVLTVAIGLGGCLDDFEDPLPPRDGVYYPIGAEMHPDGRFLYVVNSNFDLRYRANQGGTVTVIDTETGEILDEASPFIPSFGAQIAINEDATRAYVPSRHRDGVTVLTLAEQGQAMYCDVDGELSADSRPCTVERIPDTGSGDRIPADPFGIDVGRVERNDTDIDVVYLSHLVGEDVTAIAFPEGDGSGGSMVSAGLVTDGGNQLALRPGSDEAFVAGRGSFGVHGFLPFVNPFGETEAILRGSSITLKRQSGPVDARGLDFDDEGDWMYVASRNPAAVHIVGMEGDSGPSVVSTIPLEREPSEVHAHRGADGTTRLYIPSFKFGIIEVVDVDKEAVVDVIDVGRSPYSVVSDLQPAHCNEPGERCQGYVTLFDADPDDRRRLCDDDDPRCGAVAIIDLDPDSDSYHTVIDVIE